MKFMRNGEILVNYFWKHISFNYNKISNSVNLIKIIISPSKPNVNNSKRLFIDFFQISFDFNINHFEKSKKSDWYDQKISLKLDGSIFNPVAVSGIV